MLLMASESAADPIVEAYPFFSWLRKCPERATRLIDELCTTNRALCNIVALIERQTAADVHGDLSTVHRVHVFDVALHAKGAPRGREAALQCRVTP
jgi:hypothetical protein